MVIKENVEERRGYNATIKMKKKKNKKGKKIKKWRKKILNNK